LLPSRSSRCRLARDRKVLQGLVAKLALRARLVRPAPRALKASKDPSVPRAQSESRGRLALRDHKDQSARRGRREMRVAKAQSDPPASADHQGRKVPRAHPAPPDQPARRATRARPRQFASSRVRIPLGAETTKSWPVSCAQAAPATERSARPPERQQLVYAHVVDLSRPDHALTRRHGICSDGALLFVIFSVVRRARAATAPTISSHRRIASIIINELAAAKIAANKKSPCANARPQPKADSAASASSSRRAGSVHGVFISRLWVCFVRTQGP